MVNDTIKVKLRWGVTAVSLEANKVFALCGERHRFPHGGSDEGMNQGIESLWKRRFFVNICNKEIITW
jgi:hypothetical protein